MFLQQVVLPSVISFVCCQMHVGKFCFFLCTMDVVLVKEVRLVVAMDDLDFEFWNVAFKAKVSSIGMVPLIELQIGTWKI